MAIKILNTTLLVITLIGTVFAHRAGNKHRRLLTEETQLEAELGRMSIADPSKICVLALGIREKLHSASVFAAEASPPGEAPEGCPPVVSSADRES